MLSPLSGVLNLTQKKKKRLSYLSHEILQGGKTETNNPFY